MNSNWSESTGLKTKDKSGESNLLYPNSGRLQENSSLYNKKTPEDSLKELPFSEEWIDSVSWPTNS